MEAVVAESCVSRRIADASFDWEVLEDADGRVLWVSPSCEPITGHPPDDFLRTPGLLLDIVHPEDRSHFDAHRGGAWKDNAWGEAEFRIVRPDGGVRWIGHRCRPLSLPGGASVGRRSSNREIADARQGYQELHRLNRTLRAISESDQALMRASDEKSLMQETCRIVVEECGHAMAWIGVVEDDAGKSVRPVAYAGFEEGYLDSLGISWADTERGRGPTGTAIRTGRPAICRNMLTDPVFAPWREEALKRGYASSIAFPLLEGGKAFGAITIYSRKADPFSEEEVKLLKELSGDLAYGISSARSRTAHARAEQALRESEERYRTLFESMSEGLVVGEMIFDEGGRPSNWRYLDVNSAFSQLTGLPREEVLGRLVKDVVPGLENYWLEAFGRVVNSGRGERLLGPASTLKREYEAFAWRSGPGRFAVIFTDVTERKRAEETREWLASFPGRNPFPIVEADVTGHVHFQNPSAALLCPDLEARKSAHPWLEDWESVVRVLRDGGTPALVREVMVGTRCFEQTLILVTGTDRIRVYGAEVTERKRAAGALESASREAIEERNRLEAVMEALPVGIAIIDAHGGNVHANRAFEEVWGGPRPPTRSVDDYAAYKAWWMETGQPVRPEEWASAIALREGRAVVGQRAEIERFDGRRAFVLNSAAPVVDSDGRVTGSAVAIVDITAARETEERLRELNETLEARVAERTAEAERRAHQLRALASELSQTEWRERQRLAAVLHDHLQQVLVGAKFNLEALKGSVLQKDVLSLVARVDDLLDQSLAECRSLTVALSPPVLQEGGLAGGLAWLSRRMREQHGLEVGFAVDDGFIEPADGGVKVFLFDAVRELLFNVVKHSGVRAARVFLERRDGQIEVRVEDRGKGLDRDFPRDRGDESAGFGLFSLRQRLELIGGAMRLESAPGNGTSITLIAPAAAVPEGNANEAAAPARPPAEETGVAPSRPKRDDRIRVVIADDHKILRQGLVALLNVEGGIDVVGEAADGVEAVELARSLQPDVVIMDIAMPRMNGIEATRQITSEMPGLRVIGLSMHEDETIAAAMREAGAVAFLTKGRPSDVLVSTIRAVYSGGVGP